ncbi:P-loop containing nucleoside triphosphate hydrolase protein, partial [Piptocephalis cylindrospora]
ISSIALDKKQEVMLIKDITTFLKDQKFYEHLGLPYRRGYLFHGRPGTGKTSLINAIAGELGRNLYFVNLRDVVNDTQLQNAFSMVPQGQIIVMEDIDAMTKVVHRRLSPNGDHAPPEDQELTMTLSALLGCLDGYIMQPGNIVIMTTNHPEVLDPALIRPGRIDLTLELGCATRYQIRRMYDNIVLTEQNEPESEIKPIDEEWLANFPEDLIPPCEVARQMLLHRRNP